MNLSATVPSVTVRVFCSSSFFFTFLVFVHVIFLFLSYYVLRECTPPPPPDDFMNDDIDAYLIAMDTSIAPGPSVTCLPEPPLADSICSKQSAAANHRTRLDSEAEEEEDKTADSGRPPNKKVWFSIHIHALTKEIAQNGKKLADIFISDGAETKLMSKLTAFYLHMASCFYSY